MIHAVDHSPRHRCYRPTIQVSGRTNAYQPVNPASRARLSVYVLGLPTAVLPIPPYQQSLMDDQRAAELSEVRTWIARDRAPDQLATMLWDRTFLDPAAVFAVVATTATRWSTELTMSVARSDALLHMLAARDKAVVAVLPAAYSVAFSIAGIPVASLLERRRDEVVRTIRQLNFLTLLLDHPLYGADQNLHALLAPHAFLNDMISSALRLQTPDESQQSTAADSSKLSAIVEAGIIARGTTYSRLAAGASVSPLHDPALRDAVRLLASPRLVPQSAIALVDILIRSGMNDRADYDGFTSAIERLGECRTRAALREHTAHARSVGVLPDHWLLLLSLLSRIGFESEEGLQLLGHCWRIEDDTLLDDFEPRQLLVLPNRAWHSLVGQALLSADELSLELTSKLQARFPERIPDDQQLREIIAAHMNFGGENHRAAGLRMLELIAEREGARDPR